MNSAARDKLRHIFSRITVQQALIAKAHAGIQRDLDSLALLLNEEPSVMNRATQLAAEAFATTTTRLYTKIRTADIVVPRQVAMYLGQLAGVTSILAGNHFSCDHTTALSAKRSIQNRIDTDPAFAAKVQRLFERLNQSISAPSASSAVKSPIAHRPSPIKP